MEDQCIVCHTNKYRKIVYASIVNLDGCLKEQRKVLENSLKMYLKSPWKVLWKGMSWSVGTVLSYFFVFAIRLNINFFAPRISYSIAKLKKNNPGHKFWTIRDRNFIFGIQTLLMIFFQTQQSLMTLWRWP